MDRPVRINAPMDQRGLGVLDADDPATAGHFDAGPAYRTQRDGRRDLLLLLTLDGRGLLRHDGQSAPLGPGSAALYPPDTPQDYATDPAAGRWVFRWAHARPRPRWTPAMRWRGPWPGLGLVTLDDPAARREAINALARARTLNVGPTRLAGELTLNAIEAALLCCAACDPGLGTALDERVRHAIDLADRCVDRPLTVADMADAACLSAPRLTVLFREQLGVSPARYAERVRLNHALSLLRTTGLSIKEVAAAAGFPDPAHFSRRFRDHFGHPPSDHASRRRST